jgi:hypothetical protein
MLSMSIDVIQLHLQQHFIIVGSATLNSTLKGSVFFYIQENLKLK